MTREELPDATIEFYDYGAAYWLPTGSTDGCWNLAGCSVRGNGPGSPGPSCPDGMCTSLGFAMNESFLLEKDPMFSGFALSLCRLTQYQLQHVSPHRIHSRSTRPIMLR